MRLQMPAGTLSVVSGLSLALVLGLTLGLPAEAQDARTSPTGLATLFEDGTTTLDFRYRFEYVDQDAFSEEAEASTLRTRLNFQSGSYRDFSFVLELDNIREVIWDDFNAGAGNTPSRTQFPVVADPEGTEVNQGYLEYRGLDVLAFRLGRERIALDNQRFVGPVGWRQNEQTFDGASVRYGVEPVDVFYAYVSNVNTIFGENVPAGDQRQDGTHLFNISGNLGELGVLTSYVYNIDDEDAPQRSTLTTGLRLTGQAPIDDFTVTYAGELARQRDSGDNPVSFDANYWRLDIGLAFDRWSLTAGSEVLGGDADNPGEMFRTPLATLHAFNGWADEFLTTPAAGLEDLFLHFETEVEGTTIQLRYHDFSAQDGSADFGTEVDFALGPPLGEHLRGELILAEFNGDGGFDDTTKLWLMLSARF